MSNLEALASDIRNAYQDANLPHISGGGQVTESSTSRVCQTDLSKKKVLLIGIDGLRADVASMVPLPNIRRLQSMGTYSFWADIQSTAREPQSGPGWSSLFTGVEASRHLVDGNDDLRDLAVPTVFKMAKDKFNLKIAASVSWDPLLDDVINYEDCNTLEAGYKSSYNDDDMAATAEAWILSEKYDFVFAAFDGPDETGHKSGFDGYNQAYYDRVISVDVWVGRLLDAVLSTSAGEEWLIVLTSDHGGESRAHDNYGLPTTKVPFLVASNSPRVNVGYMTMDDPGSHMDALPTIMHFLNSSAVPDGLDGQVFGFLDHTRV